MVYNFCMEIVNAKQMLEKANSGDQKVKEYYETKLADLQKKYDKLSQELRETDTQIQAANWTTDLIE